MASHVNVKSKAKSNARDVDSVETAKKSRKSTEDGDPDAPANQTAVDDTKDKSWIRRDSQFRSQKYVPIPKTNRTPRKPRNKVQPRTPTADVQVRRRARRAGSISVPMAKQMEDGSSEGEDCTLTQFAAAKTPKKRIKKPKKYPKLKLISSMPSDQNCVSEPGTSKDITVARAKSNNIPRLDQSSLPERNNSNEENNLIINSPISPQKRNGSISIITTKTGGANHAIANFLDSEQVNRDVNDEATPARISSVVRCSRVTRRQLSTPSPVHSRQSLCSSTPEEDPEFITSAQKCKRTVIMPPVVRERSPTPDTDESFDGPTQIVEMDENGNQIIPLGMSFLNSQADSQYSTPNNFRFEVNTDQLPPSTMMLYVEETPESEQNTSLTERMRRLNNSQGIGKPDWMLDDDGRHGFPEFIPSSE